MRPLDPEFNFESAGYDNKSIYGVSATMRAWPEPFWDRSALTQHWNSHQAEFDSLRLKRDLAYRADTIEAYDRVVKIFLAPNVADTPTRFTRIGADGFVIRYDRPTSLVGAIDPKTGRIRSLYRKGITDPSIARAYPLSANSNAERNLCLGLATTKHARRQSMQRNRIWPAPEAPISRP